MVRLLEQVQVPVVRRKAKDRSAIGDDCSDGLLRGRRRRARSPRRRLRDSNRRAHDYFFARCTRASRKPNSERKNDQKCREFGIAKQRTDRNPTKMLNRRNSHEAVTFLATIADADFFQSHVHRPCGVRAPFARSVIMGQNDGRCGPEFRCHQGLLAL